MINKYELRAYREEIPVLEKLCPIIASPGEINININVEDLTKDYLFVKFDATSNIAIIFNDNAYMEIRVHGQEERTFTEALSKLQGDLDEVKYIVHHRVFYKDVDVEYCDITILKVDVDFINAEVNEFITSAKEVKTETKTIETTEIYKEETNMLKHIIWQDDYNKGRVGVLLEDDRITIKTIAGNALPVCFLCHVLYEALGIETIEEGIKLSDNRVNPWKIETHTGMSGSKDFVLRFLQDEEMMDAPIANSIHVSMYKKLNENITNVWLGDLVILLDAIAGEYEQKKVSDIKIFDPRGNFEDYTSSMTKVEENLLSIFKTFKEA